MVLLLWPEGGLLCKEDYYASLEVYMNLFSDKEITMKKVLFAVLIGWQSLGAMDFIDPTREDITLGDLERNVFEMIKHNIVSFSPEDVARCYELQAEASEKFTTFYLRLHKQLCDCTRAGKPINVVLPCIVWDNKMVSLYDAILLWELHENKLVSEAKDYKKESYFKQRALQLKHMYETLEKAVIKGNADARFVEGCSVFDKGEGDSSDIDILEHANEDGKPTDHVSFEGTSSHINWLVLTVLSLVGYGMWKVFFSEKEQTKS